MAGEIPLKKAILSIHIKEKENKVNDDGSIYTGVENT